MSDSIIISEKILNDMKNKFGYDKQAVIDYAETSMKNEKNEKDLIKNKFLKNLNLCQSTIIFNNC